MMKISELQEQITHKLRALKEQCADLPAENSMQAMMNIVDGYAGIFDDLFGGADGIENYVGKLNAASTREDTEFYLKALSALKMSIEALPFNATVKSTMLSRIYDNCDPLVLKHYEQGLLNESGYQRLLKTLHLPNITDTVTVKTWGTKHEIGNGLRNILQQQMQGGGVGHASVTMRLKADDRGLELIKKHCMNEDGSVKIPHKIKQYGNESVYEIYWSYWPEGLMTLESDIETELSGDEHKNDLDTLREMPLELKSRYLYQKYTKERQIPLISSAVNSETPSIFKSDASGYRKMGLSPAAIIDASTIEPDLARRHYLDLKVKQCNLEEEISSLGVLNTNYFSPDKAYHSETMDGSQPIKESSNFLILLKRFRTQLSQQQVIAQVLLNHKISPEQSSLLQKDILRLISKKEHEKSSLLTAINEAAVLIQENRAEINLLQSQIDELETGVYELKSTLDYLEIVFSVLEKVKEGGSHYKLTDSEIEIFSKFSDTFADDKKNNDFINGIIHTGMISHEDVLKTNPAFLNEYQLNIRTQLEEKNSQLSVKSMELTNVSQSKKAVRVNFYESAIAKIDKKITTNQEDSEKFADFSQAFLKYKPSLDRLNRKKENWATLDRLILEDLESTTPAKKGKGGKGKAKAAKAAISPLLFEISDETEMGTTIHTITTFDEMIQLKNKIEREIKQLEQDKKKSPDKEPFMFSFHDKKGDAVSRQVKSSADLARIEVELDEGKKSLLKSKEDKLSQLLRLKLGSHISAEEFAEQRIKRGSSNDVSLSGFNVEKMLEQASAIASSANEFHLGRENCSTTSMKLLHAGAPLDKQAMFTAPSLKEGETVASNAFLSNPQAVYAAVTVVARADQGDVKAKVLLQEKKSTSPESSYNALLNTLVARMTTRNNVEFNLFRNTPIDGQVAESQFSWTFYLKFIPHLLKLYRDIFQVVKLDTEKNHDTLQAKVANEIKILSGKAYHLIDTPNAPLAIQRMLVALTTNKANVPFFETDTLSRVEQYILTIEAKETKTPEELEALTNFKRIEAERDARVQCIENAVISGAEVKQALLERQDPIDGLNWMMSDTDKIDALVKHFVLNYQTIRNKNPLSFLTSNFSLTLTDKMSPQQKLELIQQQINKYPDGRSAQALKMCLEADPLLTECIALQKATPVSTESRPQAQLHSEFRETISRMRANDNEVSSENTDSLSPG